MMGLGFHEQKKKHSTTKSFFKARDDSPDSVILTLESNLSLFSSTSGSVDRSSFASDVHDHEISLISELSKDYSSGPDLSLSRSLVRKQTHPARNGDKAKEEEETETEDLSPNLYPAKNYISQALRECHHQLLTSEALQAAKQPDRRRTASLDLKNLGSNNGTSPSPRLTVMKKTTVSSRKSGAFPSPGTPNYRPGNVGMQKGWSSERVPLAANGGRRNAGAALLPLQNVRTLPSKWEDAEKWIFSPVSGDCGGKTSSQSQLPQRRPKAKSGPLGPPGLAYYSMYSPAIPMLDSRNRSNFIAASPFSAGGFNDGLPGQSHFCGDGSGGCAGGGESYSESMEPCIMRSASVHGWSTELLSRASFPDSLGGKHDVSKDAATMISPTVSRRDMATQMSPESSTCSSPKARHSFSPSPPPSFLPIVEMKDRHSSPLEVRDVQVDDRVIVTRWSKKHGTKRPENNLAIVEDWKNKAAESRASAWEAAESTKSTSKSKSEDAKITAWENLQKAKAEAAIRKLEMKLEKKRSSSMDKIMNKLKSAQRKAQEMRSSVSDNQAHQVTKNTDKIKSFRKRGQIGSLSGCFACPAF